MTDTVRQRMAFPLDRRSVLAATLVALVGVALLLRLHLVFQLNVNWDEFFFLHHVYAYLRGELTMPLQTFHVHFFTWLPGVAQNEVDQVIAARLVVYALLLGSAALTFLIARVFLDRTAALFAVLCYLSLSYAVEHGTSFRADPIASFLFLASVALLLRWPGRIVGPAVAGLLAAAAVMVTIKSVFYLPVLGVLLIVGLLQRAQRGKALCRMAAFGCVFAAGFATLYLLHQATLVEPELAAIGRHAGAAANKVIMLDNLFPRWRYLVLTLVNDAVIWLTLLVGGALLVAQLFRRGSWPPRRQVLLLSFLLPLATLAFYRNAFPYYYVFLLAPAVLLCGVTFQRLLSPRDTGNAGRAFVVAVVLVLTVSASLGKVYLANAQDRTGEQRRTVALVHELFPEPVAYIDRTTTVTSFRKVGFFMSTWGVESYRAAGKPIFRDLIMRQRPLFLLATTGPIDPRRDQAPFRAVGYALFEEDYQVIKDNYVHHWGELYLAGKTLRFNGGAEGIDFEMLIGGTYTLESDTAVEIDGQRIAPGSTVTFDAGWHHAKALPGAAATAVLRWGDRLPRPTEPASAGPFFTGF